MKRINNVSKKMGVPTLKKKVPKTEETILQEKIDQLLPNDLHNLEDTSFYLNQRRKNSKINPKKLLNFFANPLVTVYRDKFLKYLINDPSYYTLNEETLTIDEYKNHVNSLLGKMGKALDYKYEDFLKNPEFFSYLGMAAGIIDPCLATKVGVHYGLYSTTLKELGTSKHLKYYKRALELKDLGCFMMTEMGHGSNLQGLLTTATYLHEERCFVINTPHEIGRKFWIGNLARTANYGLVVANLIVNQHDYGIHIFLVKIRDIKGNVVPGIKLGDCGPKLGMNGVDNGWAIFDRLKIPYDNLLDKYSSINEQGEFMSTVEKKNVRFGLQLAALSGGRLMVSIASLGCILACTSIAARYLTVRKQFGDKKYRENTLITYPSVQKKLIPLFAKAVIHLRLSDQLNRDFVTKDISQGTLEIKLLHALSSYVKVQASYDSLKQLNNVRELCGGHGYSCYSKLPTLVRDQNIQITWEGTNDVLIQQTAKFLLTTLGKYLQKNKIEHECFNFIRDFEDEERIEKELKNINDYISNFKKENNNYDILLRGIKRLMQYRLKTLMEICFERFSLSIDNQNNIFKAFNKTLPFALLDLSKYFGEYMAFTNFEKDLLNLKKRTDFKQEYIFSEKMFLIFAINSIKESSHYLSEVTSLSFHTNLSSVVLNVYSTILNEFVHFFDVITVDDLLLDSTLGSSKGDPYRLIMNKIRSDPNNMGKKDNWDTIMKLRKSM